MGVHVGCVCNSDWAAKDMMSQMNFENVVAVCKYRGLTAYNLYGGRPSGLVVELGKYMPDPT